MNDKIRIILVEDHQLLREGLRVMLSLQEEYDVIGEAADGVEATRLIRQKQPDLVVLDISMPRMDGFSVLRDIKRSYPGIKILALSIHESNQYVVEAFRAGADGYCVKDSTREELLLAMRATLQGKRYISPGIAKSVLTGFLEGKKQVREKTDWETLTAREKEVLKLISEDYQNKEIAHLLNISVKTVEKHRASLIEKLNRHSTVAITVYAYEQGLVVKKS